MASLAQSDQLIKKAVEAGNALFPLAQEASVYRASIAYLLQNVKSFLQAIQPFRSKELITLEVQAIQRYIGLATHFATVLPHLGQKWLTAVLNWPSTHIHTYIDAFRKGLIEISRQLSLEPNDIIKFDQMQDNVNKISDLQHLKQSLRSVRESAISCQNSVDVQQLIEVRLHSIGAHIPSKSKDPKKTSLDVAPEALQSTMDRELSVFTYIDIPCDDLKLGEPLGTGGFGTVYIATRLSTCELLAVKEVRSDRLTLSTWASLYSEVATMADLKHQYVLELVGAHIKEPYRIITRYCPGKSLFDRIHRARSNTLTHSQLTTIAYQVAEGMRFLHEHGVVHRDLKTMNILLDEYDTAKIADFGLAGMLKENKDLIGGVGTPHYTAPEVLERKRYGPKVDTYSFGIILWEMCSKQIPFLNKTHPEIYDFVVSHQWRLPIPNNAPPGLRKLISQCWAPNPKDRPEFSQIVQQFRNGLIYFLDTDQNEPIRDPLPVCPPLDKEYLIDVLSNPSHKQFPSIATFLAKNIDEPTRSFVRSTNIFDRYNDKCANPDMILLLASVLLSENEFPDWIEKQAKKIMETSLATSSEQSTIAAIRFCLKVPIDLLPKVSEFIDIFVGRMNSAEISSLVLQLVARLPVSKIQSYSRFLISFFTPKSIDQIKDQATLNAIDHLLPIISDQMTPKQMNSFISILENDLEIPISLIHLFIEKTDKSYIVSLIRAIIKAAARTDVTDALISVLQDCSNSDLNDVAKNLDVFDQINRLISERRNMKAALLMLFRLTMLPAIPPVLANHPILQSLLQIDGYEQHRLQIFTSLFSSQQFCSDTTISEGVLKLLVKSMSIESLSDFALHLIGALSSHQPGCTLISETGIMSLFSQMFLSSTMVDSSTALVILRNVAVQKTEIPQLSLIISCLMQDLLYSMSHKMQIMVALIELVRMSPSVMQEMDIQNSVLPLVNINQEPAMVTLALKLLSEVDLSKYRRIQPFLIQRIYELASNDNMQYPELICAHVNLLSKISMAYDVTSFVRHTKYLEYVQDAMSQMKDFDTLVKKVDNSLYILTQVMTTKVDF